MSPANPHDALFRRVLGEPEHAASELRSVLPPALVADLELDRLTPRPGSSVDEDLRWRHCDLLFSTRCRGRDAFVYRYLTDHPDAEEACTTTADMLRAEGRAEALLQLLALRFGTVPPAAEATVRAASVERIEAWTARVLTAGSVDDVLR